MRLPTYQGTLETYQLSRDSLTLKAPNVALTRTAFATAHVISDPLAERDPWHGRPAMDWDNTLRFRHYLWDQGLHLAEAMDTAQRGAGVDWHTASELIQRSLTEARTHPLKPRVACGAGTDHFAIKQLQSEAALIAAYSQQMEMIEAAGGQCIIMASRALPAISAGPDVYARIYGYLLEQAAEPVILHWLGDVFDPALRGYWGYQDIAKASTAVLSIIEDHQDKIDGIKISLLDQTHEEAFRKRLPSDVRLYTGDDFNYPALIAGDGNHYSHALLGIIAAIAPALVQALEALAKNDMITYKALLDPTVPLAREIFKSPTQCYKAGIAFLAWLNGAQDHFIMPAGFQSSREICHYAEVFRLADQAKLLLQPDLAIERMRTLLDLYGIH